nr:outer membrane beta-barrel protein [Hyphomicrobium sp.]
VGLVGDENFLIFATGGLAYGGLDHSINSNNFNGVTFSGTQSDTAIGWTAGGGVEYLLNDNWAFRADAMYIDFGSTDETFTATGGGCPGTCTATVGYNDSFWVARVGLTYLFGAPVAAPVPASYEPMK